MNIGRFLREFGETLELLGEEAYEAGRNVVQRAQPIVNDLRQRAQIIIASLRQWVLFWLAGILVWILAVITIAAFAPSVQEAMVPLVAIVFMITGILALALGSIQVSQHRSVRVFWFMLAAFALPKVGRWLKECFGAVVASFIVGLCISIYCTFVPVSNRPSQVLMLIMLIMTWWAFKVHGILTGRMHRTWWIVALIVLVTMSFFAAPPSRAERAAVDSKEPARICSQAEPQNLIPNTYGFSRINLWDDCYHGPFTVDTSGNVEVVHSANPGDGASVWCSGRSAPQPVRVGYEPFGNDFTDCSSFYLKGRGFAEFRFPRRMCRIPLP